ncbi:hypothetical protein BD410DRAFT_784599 [Rickenella mellea]|uniref:DUF6534 domain-containing protein n=1 Tax=Rickenella mellea TaxID=50990 RepID=A0A4Y7QFE1_9AGAM|nr:hypothetical protein BD410DRAFT_784599 [Rickenella mellea]
MSSAVPTLQLNLDDTWGALFIGLLISVGLYGLLTLQCYLCFQQFPDDRLHLRIVALLWLLNTFHIALISYAVYGYLITNFMNPLFLLSGTWPMITHIFVNSFIAWFVQLFFAHRLWKISNKNIYLVVMVALLATVQFSLGAAVSIKSFKLRRFILLKTMEGIISASLSLTVACDVLITCTLLYFLNKSRTGFRRTDSLINDLMWASLSTGLFPSVFAIAQLITFLAMPNNLINASISLFLCKVYSTSMLATINGRASSRAKWAANDNTVELSDVSSSPSTRLKQNAPKERSVAIFMTRSSSVRTDSQYHSHLPSFGTTETEVKIDADRLHV